MGGVFTKIETCDFRGTHIGSWNERGCVYELTEAPVQSDTGQSLDNLLKSYQGSLTITQVGDETFALRTPIKAFQFKDFVLIERQMDSGSYQTAKLFGSLELGDGTGGRAEGSIQGPQGGGNCWMLYL